MGSRTNRNNVLAGAFLVLGLVLTAGIAFWIGEAADALLGGKTRYAVRFGALDPLPTLGEGSQVTLAGQPVGSVVRIDRTGEPRDDGRIRPTRVEVVVAIDDGIALNEGAAAVVRAPLLGGVGSLDIVSLGPPDASPLPEGGVLEGRGSAGMGEVAADLLAGMGITREAVEGYKAKIDAIFDDGTAFAGNMRTGSETFVTSMNELGAVTGAASTDIEDTADRVRATIRHAESLMARLGSDEGEWKLEIDRTLREISEASARAPTIADDAAGLVARVREDYEQYRTPIGNTLTSVESFSKYLDEEARGQFDPLITGWAELAARLNRFVAVEAPEASRLLTDTRLAATQANLFIEELRAQPWRLLKPPRESDLSREPIYRAARRYAAAVADLRAVSQSLDRALQQDPTAGGGDAAELVRIREALSTAYEEFTEAERLLLDRLAEPAP